MEYRNTLTKSKIKLIKAVCGAYKVQFYDLGRSFLPEYKASRETLATFTILNLTPV